MKTNDVSHSEPQHRLQTAALTLLLMICSLTACKNALSAASDPESGPNPGAATTRPNIIFLLTDDHRADSLSIAGHPVVRTPNIDDLANNGVRYTNAFTVQPICAPSRYAFLSGQYERTSGLGFNSPYQVSESQWSQTYPALLRDAGYHTGFIGKFGVQYYSFDGSAASKFDYWRGHDGWLPFFPKELPENPATAIYAEAKRDITTEIMGEYIEDFLNSRPRDQPFNLSVSFSAPHNSVVSSMYTAGADPQCTDYACKVMGYSANGNPKLQGHRFYDTLYRDTLMQISADTGTDPNQFITQGIIDHEARKKWYAYNYEAALEPEHLIRYYQTISGIDAVVGQLISQLKELGLTNNTIIIFSSDHGLLNGEYGTGGKALLYDLVAKIPLLIYDPRESAPQPPAVKDELILSIDVPATILSYAGIPTPQWMEGTDLNARNAPREEVFLESLTVAEGNPFIEALRTRRWKYVRYFAAQDCPYTEAQLDFSAQTPVFEQLFDLKADPEERLNLAGAAPYGTVLEDFRARAQARSAMMTANGRRYKAAESVPLRDAEDAYCW